MKQENKDLLKSFKAAKKRTDTRVFVETVVDVWQKGGDIKTVSEELGITPGAVRSRIKSLSGKGVKGLELFPKVKKTPGHPN